MSVATEISPSAIELLTRDWQDVTRHAKGMQLAINRFTDNMELAVNEGHDSRSAVAQDVALYGDQLSSVGDQTLAFAESIEKGVEPLAMALVTEPSDEGASLMTNTLGTAQASAIRALGTAVLDIAEGSSKPEASSTTSTTVTSQINTAVEDQTTTDALNMSGYTFAPDADDLVTNPASLMVDVSSGESAPMIVPVDDAASLGMQETMNVQGQSPSAPIDVDLL
ncbi:hypothetical protein BJ912DRAFT_522508 [Pholiota molesta]|nr:hypothetical protein BJ912DRAFT_522508 [Pholiota molesta]